MYLKKYLNKVFILGVLQENQACRQNTWIKWADESNFNLHCYIVKITLPSTMLKNFGPGDRFPEYVSADAFIILFCLFLLASMNDIYILMYLLFSNIFFNKGGRDVLENTTEKGWEFWFTCHKFLLLLLTTGSKFLDIDAYWWKQLLLKVNLNFPCNQSSRQLHV